MSRFFALLSLVLITACGYPQVNTPEGSEDTESDTSINPPIVLETDSDSYVSSETAISDPFDYLNVLRKSTGMTELSWNGTLMRSAMNHASYMQLNNVVAHEESSGLPGFTGTTPGDRVVQEG